MLFLVRIVSFSVYIKLRKYAILAVLCSQLLPSPLPSSVLPLLFFFILNPELRVQKFAEGRLLSEDIISTARRRRRHRRRACALLSRRRGITSDPHSPRGGYPAVAGCLDVLY